MIAQLVTGLLVLTFMHIWTWELSLSHFIGFNDKLHCFENVCTYIKVGVVTLTISVSFPCVSWV